MSTKLNLKLMSKENGPTSHDYGLPVIAKTNEGIWISGYFRDDSGIFFPDVYIGPLSKLEIDYYFEVPDEIEISEMLVG